MNRLHSKRLKIEQSLFCICVILSALSYVVQAVLAIIQGEAIFWSITNSLNGVYIDGGMFGQIIQYSKDVSVVLLGIILLKYSKSRKVYAYLLVLIVYGSLLLFANIGFNLMYIIAGIRAFLYIFVAIAYFKAVEFSYPFVHRMQNIIRFLVLFESFIVIAQIHNSGNYTSIGKGGYRYCATFGNAIGFGTFLSAVSIFELCFSVKSASKFLYKKLIIFSALIALSIASGTRSAMLVCIISLACYMFSSFENKIKGNKASIRLIFIAFGAIILYFIFDYLVVSTERGELMVSGGTRLSVFLELFNVHDFSDIIQLIFGHGLGYATNNAVNLGIKVAYVYDGTFTTILAQFGLLGFCVLTYFIVRIISAINKCCKYNRFCFLAFTAEIGVFLLTGNFFEQIFMCLVNVYCFYYIKYVREDINEMRI